MDISVIHGGLAAGVITGLIFTGVVFLGISITNRLLDEGWLSTLLAWCFLLAGFCASMYFISWVFQAPEFSGSTGEGNRHLAFYIYFSAGPLLTLILLITQKQFRRL